MDKPRRVVITGMGVVAPNGVGLRDFSKAIAAGVSGIAYQTELEALNFGCRIAGKPPVSKAQKESMFTELERKQLDAHNIYYGIIAAEEAWTDAKLPAPRPEATDWNTGCVFGVGVSGLRAMHRAMHLIDNGKVKRLGSSTVPQTMPSGISAYLGGRFGLGNWVTTNASACGTGTEAIRIAAEHIRLGKARRMLCGACDTDGPYIWGGFDAMRVLTRKFNDDPSKGSRPMSATASGFVPGAGAGAFILEDLDSARARGARIYAEILGGASNAGGHRKGGSMTAPNPEGVLRCIRSALQAARVKTSAVDAISGHLTSTKGDPLEVEAWSRALEREGNDFPVINALKSMIGHCLSAAGAIESVAAILQVAGGWAHPSINCEDLHPDIASRIGENCIPHQRLEMPDLNIIAKSSFGFGDVNSVVVFGKFAN